MKKLFTYKALWLLLLLPLFSGCNDSDDLQSIFTGKTWKLSYINYKDNGGMMEGFSKESMKIFNENKEAYTIIFTGTEEDSRISGSISGRVITSDIKGTWSANGKNNEFHANIGDAIGPDDLSKKFVEGLKNASSYTGDEKGLFLYYKSGQQTYVLAFHVKR